MAAWEPDDRRDAAPAGRARAAARTPPRGRPPRLTRTAIADAALEVGFRDLTMATVAERLRTSHSALYRHVRDRNALLILAVDRLIERVAWPPPTGEWRTDLAARGWLIWRLLEANPGLDRELLGITSVPPRMVERFTETVEHLQACGLPLELAFLATDVVFDLAVSQFVEARPMADATRRHLEDTAGEPAAGPPAGPGPVGVADLIRASIADPPELWFERKLDLVLDGVAARLHGSAD